MIRAVILKIASSLDAVSRLWMIMRINCHAGGHGFKSRTPRFGNMKAGGTLLLTRRTRAGHLHGLSIPKPEATGPPSASSLHKT